MLISLKHITKSYNTHANNVVAVDDVDVSVDSGEFVAVVGPPLGPALGLGAVVLGGEEPQFGDCALVLDACDLV